MSSRTRLFLMRHAEVAADYHRCFGGRIDMDLSPLGKQQARSLASYLKRFEFSSVYSSPMARVRQTLEAYLETVPHEPQYVEDLREVDFGDWTGLRWEQVKEKFHVSAFDWLLHLEEAGIPNAECGKTFRARVEPCLQRILRDHPGQSVAIFCHGGVIRMLLAILLDLPLPRMSAFEIDYGSLTLVEIAEPRKAEIQLLNLTPWRDLP